MLRLPKFELLEPESVEDAVRILAENPGEALVVAGGTDLIPNMKHRLFEPSKVVSLSRIEALRGVRRESGYTVIGAMTSLADVTHSEEVRAVAPALAQAAGLVAGRQLRNVGTLGGNVMLDTRCRWYNQTYFWRKALGFCLKKDGTLCHVIEGGNRCVAAASNDTAPALMSLGASVLLLGPNGPREVLVADLWVSDGIVNKSVAPDELLVEVRVPEQSAGHHGAYGKLRDRGTIDFPLFGCAVRMDLNGDGVVQDADVCAVALVARPVRLKGVAELLSGTTPGTAAFDDAVEGVAALAHRRCRPMDNVPGEAAYRREMVPVYVRATLQAAVAGDGPVHQI